MWRALVVELVCLGGVAGGAWVGSKALSLDGRLLELPAAVPALVVIVLGLGLLRARPGFAVVPGLAADAAACAGAVLINDHLLSAGRLHLDTLGNRLLAGSLAVALLVSVLGIVVAAVSGHLHPREDSAAAPAEAAGPAGSE
ncbi:hypothetical protein DN069_33435 [Streptacidiphilus pinicola]|uniref:Uncharacterized protein n=1 Tax=Streptacidiphilus pinicola TaxID=2219663 RepID=A0A2X0K198_9ACTN|nr:hypothetical protein DN069_33435 [Streptacidiphilus pinicola]